MANAAQPYVQRTRLGRATAGAKIGENHEPTISQDGDAAPLMPSLAG